MSEHQRTAPTPILTIRPARGGSFLWMQRNFDEPGLGSCLCGSTWWSASLPFSEELLQKLFDWWKEWADVFDAYSPERPEEEISRWDWLAFHARGLQLARWLKEEVGAAYRVVYEKAPCDPNRAWEKRRETLADGTLAALPPPPLPKGRKKTPRFCERIISGGQTGADRAALDFAIRLRYPHGGFAPCGRMAEDGRIAPKYQLIELTQGSYRQRTRRNVLESEGTLIVNTGALDGGTLATQRFAQKLARPCFVAQLDGQDMPHASARALAWLRAHAIRTLNIAGPRESKRPGIYRLTAKLLDAMHAAHGAARRTPESDWLP